MEGLFAGLYRRLGVMYLAIPLLFGFISSVTNIVLVIGFGCLGFLGLPLDQTRDIMNGALVAGCAGFLVGGISLVKALPAIRWMAGQRDSELAPQVWTIATRDLKRVIVFFAIVITIAVLPSGRAVARSAHLTTAATMLVLIVPAIVNATVAILNITFIENWALPVVREVSAYLRDDFEPQGRASSLTRRILPTITLFTFESAFFTMAVVRIPTSVEGRVLTVWAAAASVCLIALAFGYTLARSITSPMKTLLDATRDVRSGNLDVRVPLVSNDEAGELTRGFNAMVVGIRERAALQGALASYVDPIIAERLLAEGELLAGEDVDVTLLFLDIRGFTRISERQDPRMIVRYLNVFFSRIVPVITRHGGHVNRFTGDGLLAVFGVPERHADHADRAVNAAREIARTADDLYGASSLLGMGINSGHVIAGTVGGGGHLEFTVMGDAVNVASRVQEMTRTSGDPILLTGATKSELSSSDDLEHRGTMPVRGRSAPIDVFAVPLRATTEPDPYGWESWRWDETLFAGTAKYYERGRTPYAPGLADALADALLLDGAGRLLDVGCGPGTIALRLAHLFAEVVGVDADRDMIEEARRLALARNVGNATWLCMRAEELPDELGTFDVVAFAASFHWMDRPAVASTVRTMLEPGGVAIQIDAPAYRFEARMAERFPHPVVPQHEIVELRRRYLGPHKRAGQSFRNTSPSGEDAIFRAAGFLPAEMIRVPDGRVIEWTIDDVVANVFSSSSTAPHLFGDRMEEFEADLRAMLERESPSGLFSVSLPTNRINIWRVKP